MWVPVVPRQMTRNYARNSKTEQIKGHAGSVYKPVTLDEILKANFLSKYVAGDLAPTSPKLAMQSPN
ncbi:hypothetical protein N7456_009643 [Penicillium angulare]|uniref:Uncharacterized protein n=1 Tax=Penicillium angulare TaxID=116970 RepID=A0A9W9K6C1_9EURO|nr:hypothetical protein N7456_009643 [Penicillium angulare]